MCNESKHSDHVWISCYWWWWWWMDVWSPNGLTTVGVRPERDWTAKPFRAHSHREKAEAKTKNFFCRLFFEYFPFSFFLFRFPLFPGGNRPLGCIYTEWQGTLMRKRKLLLTINWPWLSESHKRFSFFCHSVYTSLNSDPCLRAASVFTPDTNGNGKKERALILNK